MTAVSTPFPAPWIAVLLDAPLEPGTGAAPLAEALAARGIAATITREGWLAFQGDFLVRAVAAPYPRDLFAHPGAIAAPTRPGAAYLEISGGGLDADRIPDALRTESGAAPEKTTRFL